MRHLRYLAILCFALSATAASAAEPFEFKLLMACDEEHDAYGPDKLVAERVDSKLVVTGWAAMACGEHAAHPAVLPDWASLTLTIDSHNEGPVAACNCTSKFQFTLSQKVPAGRAIYLVKDGKGTAHVVAP